MTPNGASDDPARPEPRSGWASGVGGATGATLGRPDTWPVALVGLLVRGGLVPFALPIVVLPTMTGLATALGPAVVSIALGQPDAGVARFVALVVGTAVAWLVANVLLGALTDAVVVRAIADEILDRPRATRVRSVEVGRIALVRAAAHLPLLVAAAWGASRLVAVAREELIMPSDLSVPIVLRVIGGAPEVIALLGLAWLGGEAVGELAVRSVLLEGSSAAGGLGRAIVLGLAHLPAVLGTLALGSLGLVVLVVPPMIAVSVAWSGERGVLLGDGPVVAAVVGSVVLSMAWLGALALASLAATWRSALWTAEALRHGSDRPSEAPLARLVDPAPPSTG